MPNHTSDRQRLRSSIAMVISKLENENRPDDSRENRLIAELTTAVSLLLKLDEARESDAGSEKR